MTETFPKTIIPMKRPVSFRIAKDLREKKLKQKKNCFYRRACSIGSFPSAMALHFPTWTFPFNPLTNRRTTAKCYSPDARPARIPAYPPPPDRLGCQDARTSEWRGMEWKRLGCRTDINMRRLLQLSAADKMASWLMASCRPSILPRSCAPHPLEFALAGNWLPVSDQCLSMLCGVPKAWPASKSMQRAIATGHWSFVCCCRSQEIHPAAHRLTSRPFSPVSPKNLSHRVAEIAFVNMHKLLHTFGLDAHRVALAMPPSRQHAPELQSPVIA